MDLYAELENLLAAFDGAGVRYALCGGLALAVHGFARSTQDIDVLILPQELGRAEQVAKDCGYNLGALPMTFGNTNLQIVRRSKIVEGRPLSVDFLIVNDSLLPIWRDRQTRAWAQGDITVVSRDGLISLKLTAGRPQDFVDIQRLQEASDD